MRTTKPEKGNLWYVPTAKGGYNPCLDVTTQTDNKGIVDINLPVLANCVGFATGWINENAYEAGVISEKKCVYLGNTNAKNMVNLAKKQGLTVTETPVAGGCMVWDDGSYGHIECVVKVVGNTAYNISSAYATYIFKNKTRKKDVGGTNQWEWNKSTKYLGCINPPIKQEVIKTGTLELDGKKYSVTLKEL